MPPLRQANPCLVNSYNPRTGASLLRFAVERADNPLLVTLLLHAHCRFGLYPDTRGSTPLQAALMSSKWRPLRLLLYALRTNPQLSEMPGTTWWCGGGVAAVWRLCGGGVAVVCNGGVDDVVTVVWC